MVFKSADEAARFVETAFLYLFVEAISKALTNVRRIFA